MGKTSIPSAFVIFTFWLPAAAGADCFSGAISSGEFCTARLVAKAEVLHGKAQSREGRGVAYRYENHHGACALGQIFALNEEVATELRNLFPHDLEKRGSHTLEKRVCFRGSRGQQTLVWDVVD